MKSENNNVVFKDVVIIGNGPSGIALSYMLSGNIPYIISNNHPDEMLSMRLSPVVNECLLEQDLLHLADGLEGRSTNPVSLLLDALLHPYADVGLEIEPLVEFRKSGKEIDHIVLGKGPPGGSWHKMDPKILTLSLGSWMSLPGLPYRARDSSERRAYAYNVAKYYAQYVKDMNLTKYFLNNTLVTFVRPTKVRSRYSCGDLSTCKGDKWVAKLNEEEEDKKENVKCKGCLISHALNYIWPNKGRKKSRCCKRPREMNSDTSPTRKIRDTFECDRNYLTFHGQTDTFDSFNFMNGKDYEIPRQNKLQKQWRSNNRTTNRSISLCCDSDNLCDTFLDVVDANDSSFNLRNSFSLDFTSSKVPCSFQPKSLNCDVVSKKAKWLVESYDIETGIRTTYACKNLILANGCSDLPNRLKISYLKEPDWLVHDLRTLEEKLDRRESVEGIDPVLIVGAGLSAADAVITVRGRNVPVVHVFRNQSADLNKQLPENMYPEYHKVRQMMQDGGSTYPLYTSFPEYTPTHLDIHSNTVTLTSKDGATIKIRVSYIAVLIGSRPDLTFLPTSSLGVNKELPIDSKTNRIDMDKITHRINGFEGLYAVGPLAGDHFVRFIPGGALAVLADLYKREEYII